MLDIEMVFFSTLEFIPSIPNDEDTLDFLLVKQCPRLQCLLVPCNYNRNQVQAVLLSYPHLWIRTWKRNWKPQNTCSQKEQLRCHCARRFGYFLDLGSMFSKTLSDCSCRIIWKVLILCCEHGGAVWFKVGLVISPWWWCSYAFSMLIHPLLSIFHMAKGFCEPRIRCTVTDLNARNVYIY